VIELDLKYSQPIFLEFWRRFNNEYNNLNKPAEIIDDVEIYFDNKIGIVSPSETKEKDKNKPDVKGGSHGSDDNKYKYDILKVIEKRNQEEDAIEELIKEFEAKIDLLFEYVNTDDSGKRLIAKMKADGLAFDSEEIYDDFAKIYRKFIRRNKNLGEFFLKESLDIVNQICDDFERTLTKIYPDNEIVKMAADKEGQYNL
jgi:type I restriction enzyme R subunit